jgi:hypothetical protein
MTTTPPDRIFAADRIGAAVLGNSPVISPALREALPNLSTEVEQRVRDVLARKETAR